MQKSLQGSEIELQIEIKFRLGQTITIWRTAQEVGARWVN